ncbi:dTDP-4-dehydrorhamnose reductase [Halobacteroides halobius DSM 5150]|uniref:dTDP-4-dehydrorhamnose reductase n=1 Tax=Halobacteroides halobius (strain ATCC 35273 / DSM 5150 / MD-1) TaxID=748449 RepID=L0KB60_HALHC|nr:dTDP-4-dehydrorhamnose reductase [Halobacteroides halobius]AGB42251.1 dTDP-4-dehydrorhamnose reductase [Halobacteroides halobius DSM 5150]
MKVLITGGQGQLGTRLNSLLADKYDIYAWDIDELDITEGEETIEKVVNLNPDVVIHSAAYTDVDGCEENIDLAYQVNAYGTRNIAVACQKCDAKMVYISTDFVFDGKKDEHYIEFDQTNPLSVYGKSKLAGEKFVKDLLNKYFIVRTAWLYGKNGGNFVKTMLKLAQERDLLTVVDDQVGSPTYAKDLAKVIAELITTNLYGTYHASNNGECSWYQFAKKIFEYTDTEIEVKPVTSEEFVRPATRPSYSVMDNYSLEQGLSYEMRDWQDALKDYLEEN